MQNSEQLGCGSLTAGALAILTLCFTCLIGCGDRRPERVPVSGRVLIDGKPLTVGHVRFIPQGARSSSGAIQPDGSFTLTCYDGNDGAVPGTHRVEVAASEVVGPNSTRWYAPKKYASHTTSGLVQEITGPTDSLVIELSFSGGRPYVDTPPVQREPR